MKPPLVLISCPRFPGTLNVLLLFASILFLAREPMFGAPAGSSSPQKAPVFALPKLADGADGEVVRLEDFAGKIVVLDFFAYWCGPCKRASKEIEMGIQRYYAGKAGNPDGVPVRVIGVNIEKAQPQRTAQFVRDAGMELVANDHGGLLLQELGGSATPFLVIIDGTAGFRVAHRGTGFHGTKPLRQVIDSIKKPKPAAEADLENSTESPVIRKAEAGLDALASSDIQVLGGVVSYAEERAGTEWKVSLTRNSISADYEPFALFDFLGVARTVRDDYTGGQAMLGRRLNESLTAQIGGGAHHGFSDFRSLWLSTYYRQQFEPFFPDEYDRPEPRGFNASSGLRWEYRPATGFAEAGFLYSNDQIAPGYEMNPATGALIRGREILHTYSPTLKLENVLGPRVRSLNEFQLTLTSGREARFAYRGSINTAIGERWVWRASGGYTREDPALTAWFAGSTVEFELTSRWLVHVFGRFYKDTGEIENSRVLTTSAPGLTTWQAGGGIRYAAGGSSLSLSVAPVFANYEPVDVGTRPFTNLYRDRTWLSAQLAWAVEF